MFKKLKNKLNLGVKKGDAQDEHLNKDAFVQKLKDKYKEKKEFEFSDEEAKALGLRSSIVKRLRSCEGGAVFEKVSGVYRMGSDKDYPNEFVCVGANVKEYPKMYENDLKITCEGSSQEQVKRISLKEYNDRYEKYLEEMHAVQKNLGKVR